MQQLAVPLDEMESDMFHAAFSDDLDLCREAIDAGVNVNVRSNADLDGVGTSATALHIAAAKGHSEIVATLLEANADAKAVSGRNETPIQLATRSGNVDVVRILRSVGAAPLGAEGSERLLNQAPAWDPHKRRMKAALNGRPAREMEHSSDKGGHSQGQLENDSHRNEGKGRSRKGRSNNDCFAGSPPRNSHSRDAIEGSPDREQRYESFEDDAYAHEGDGRGHHDDGNYDSHYPESPARSSHSYGRGDEGPYSSRSKGRSRQGKGGVQGKGKKKGAAKGGNKMRQGTKADR